MCKVGYIHVEHGRVCKAVDRKTVFDGQNVATSIFDNQLVKPLEKRNASSRQRSIISADTSTKSTYVASGRSVVRRHIQSDAEITVPRRTVSDADKDTQGALLAQ